MPVLIVFILFNLFLSAKADENKLNIAVPENLKEANLMQTGMTLLKNKQLDKSLQAFNKAVEIDPSNSEAYITKGIVNSLMKDYKAAINDETMAIGIILANLSDPKLALAYNTRGHAYLANNELNLAMTDENTGDLKMAKLMHDKLTDLNKK